MGDVLGDLTSRRGHIEGHGEARLHADHPLHGAALAEMFGYATDLRSRTQGRASYTMHFLRYEQAPASVAEEVIATRARAGRWGSNGFWIVLGG